MQTLEILLIVTRSVKRENRKTISHLHKYTLQQTEKINRGRKRVGIGPSLRLNLKLIDSWTLLY